jgi:ribosomal protein S2
MRVQTDRLRDGSETLEQVLVRLEDVNETIRNVERALSRERFGERFRPALFAECRKVGGLCENVQSLKSTLGRIAEQYEQREELIADHTEGNLQRFFIGIKLVDIAQVVVVLYRNQYHTRFLPTLSDATTDFVGW